MDFSSVQDPLTLLEEWRQHAEKKGAPLVEAMTLATSSPDGRPSARTVLWKGRAGRALHFFTNYESRKGRELAANPFAAAVFHFPLDQRQFIVEGPVLRLPRGQSEAYFATRPRASQLAAWASAQSRPIASREELENRLHEVEARFLEREVPCPPHWGGFALNAERVEVWVGMPGRLHHRAEFTATSSSAWKIQLLCP